MSDRKYIYLVEPPRDPALQGWQAALAGREAARANVVLIGSSTVEGFPMTNFDRTTAQVLARMLRAKYPTPGLGVEGGRGRIGVPNQGTTPLIPSPLTFTGGTFDPSTYSGTPAYHLGANHTSWFTNVDGNNFTFTLKLWETSFDLVHWVGTSGHITGGYYKINDGDEVQFSTYHGVSSLRTTHIEIAPVPDEGAIEGGSPMSGATIEIGCTGSGFLTLSEIITYAGDENKGIAVHGVGHTGYKSSDWAVAPSTPAGWAAAIANLDPDVIVIEAGMNDALSVSAAVFATNLQSLIAAVRSAGITIPSCPILIAAPYDVSGAVSFVDPWETYVAEMRGVANSDPYIAFLNEGERMPATDSMITYDLYHTDEVHGNASGRAYATQAHLLAEALSFG